MNLFRPGVTPVAPLLLVVGLASSSPHAEGAGSPVELPHDPDDHFMTDMTDKAVAWIRCQKALTPSRPSFVHFAPGATHAPHHVPQE